MDDPTTAGVTEGFGLMFYQARWYDPGLGRFAQADSIVPPGAQGLDRYAYVNNSPLMYTDPTGHREYCEDEKGGRCPKESNNSPRNLPPPPSSDSPDYKNRYAAYLTYIEIIKLLGHVPTVEELISMTAAAEYYSYIYLPGAGNLRVYAQEALARNFYAACGGTDTSCTNDQIYQFLSGYEPWWKTTGGATPASRAQNILHKTNANPYKEDLAQDVRQITDLEYARDPQRRWTRGQVWNRPWQWRNEFSPPNPVGDFN